MMVQDYEKGQDEERQSSLGSHPWPFWGRPRENESRWLFSFKEASQRNGREIYPLGDLRVTVPGFWNQNSTEFTNVPKVGLLHIGRAKKD
jgi:hypothetical protein